MRRRSALSRFFVALLLGAALTACGDSSPKKARAATTDPFQKAIQLGELVPVAGGGAYLVAASGVYYVSADKAVLVSGLPARLLLAEVHPLADGTAILHEQIGDPPMLYLLRGPNATAITQTAERLSVPAAPPSREGYLFAMNQQLRSALKRSAQQQAIPERDDEPMEPTGRY